MKKDWTYKQFEDCIEKVKYTTKIQSKDYLDFGNFPIISQEDELISGYWNDPKDVFYTIRPLVIFGDHTRVLKYIDFDFVLGADGVKILLPFEDLEAKFLYHFLKWYNVPNLGYSRHYKLLKEISIPIPPLSIQRSIVSELDLLHSLIEKKQEQLRALDNLAQSLFYQMFGEPITNPMSWQKTYLKDKVQEMFLGPFGSALKVSCYVPQDESYCMVYEQKHAIKGSLNVETHYIDQQKFNELERFNVRGGDFIMSCRGTIGKIYQLPQDAPLGIIHPSLMKIRLKKDSFTPCFFLSLLSKIVANESTNGNCVQMAITAKDLGNKLIIYPPLSLQQSFAAKVSAIEEQKRFISQSIKDVESLLAQRMDQYFSSLPVSVLPPVVHDGSK